MKFTAVFSALYAFVAVSYAIPIGVTYSDNLVERNFYDYELDTREWDNVFSDMYERDWDEYEFYARVGPFAETSTGAKNAAHAFVAQAKAGGQLAQAASPGTSAKTVMSNNAFHLDRQQPSNAAGQHKVAVQLNHVKQGNPSTVGQVAIHGGASPSGGRVAHAMDRSINTSKETHINHPNSAGAKNNAANAAAQQAKSIKTAQAAKAGDKKAASGSYRKGGR